MVLAHMGRLAATLLMASLPALGQNDPVKLWTGSAGSASLAKVAVDPQGNIIAAGIIGSSDFPSSPTAFQPKYGGGTCLGTPGHPETSFPCNDIVVVKFSGTDGHIMAATFLGGSGDERFAAIGTDPQSNIYILGTTGSPNFPITPGAARAANGGAVYGSTGFVAKLDPGLSKLIYSTYIDANALPFAMALNEDGNAYLTGMGDPATTKGALQAPLSG